MRNFLLYFQILQGRSCLGLTTVKVEFKTIVIEDSNFYIRDYVSPIETACLNETTFEDLQSDNLVDCANAAYQARESF